MELRIKIIPNHDKPAITYEKSVFDHGFVTTGYCEDAEGKIISCKIHFGKPYWGYYQLNGSNVKRLNEYLNARFHSATLEEGLCRYAEYVLRYETRDGDRRKGSFASLNEMFAIMDKLPDVLDELKIEYEEDMSFD